MKWLKEESNEKNLEKKNKIKGKDNKQETENLEKKER